MERLQYLIDLYIPYLTTIWILCLVCAVLFIVPLGIYITSCVGSKYSKIRKLLFFNTIYLVIIYLCLALTLEFTWLESFIVSIFILGISLLMYICFYITNMLLILILQLFRPRKKVEKIKTVKQNKISEKQNTVGKIPKTNNEPHSYTITKDVSRFTSNYLKSFMKDGVTINRLQIMQDNKEDYITKLQPLLASKNQTYDIDTRTVAEFYYNYYVKKFSE